MSYYTLRTEGKRGVERESTRECNDSSIQCFFLYVLFGEIFHCAINIVLSHACAITTVLV